MRKLPGVGISFLSQSFISRQPTEDNTQMTTLKLMEAYNDEFRAVLSNVNNSDKEEERFAFPIYSHCIEDDKIELQVWGNANGAFSKFESDTDRLAHLLSKSFALEVRPHENNSKEEKGAYRIINVKNPVEVKIAKITREEGKVAGNFSIFNSRIITVMRRLSKEESS